MTAKIQQVVKKGYDDALLLVTQAIDKIMTGDGLQQQDLVISRLLRQDIIQSIENIVKEELNRHIARSINLHKIIDIQEDKENIIVTNTTN